MENIVSYAFVSIVTLMSFVYNLCKVTQIVF